MSNFDPKPLVIGKQRPGTRTARTGSEINAVSCLYMNSFDSSSLTAFKARRQGTPAEKKASAGQNKAHQGTDHQLIAKIDRENEVIPPAKISHLVGPAMSAARLELGLSQKDVAQKVNEKPSVVSAYETGKAFPDAQILGKLERALHVKLRGSEIGKKLRSPKKPEPVAKPGGNVETNQAA